MLGLAEIKKVSSPPKSDILRCKAKGARPVGALIGRNMPANRSRRGARNQRELPLTRYQLQHTSPHLGRWASPPPL